MTYYLKLTFQMTLKHIIVQLCSAVIGSLVFGAVLWAHWGWVLMSSVLAAFYAGFIYTHAWHVAKLELKTYSGHKPQWWHGLIMPASTVALTGILMLFWAIINTAPVPDDTAGMWCALIVKVLFYGWNFVFFSFKAPQGLGAAYILLIFAVCPVSSVLGYMAGMHKLDLKEKYLIPLTYKKAKKKD